MAITLRNTKGSALTHNELDANFTTLRDPDDVRFPHGGTKDIVVTVAAKTSAHRYNGTGSSSGYKLDGVESPFIQLTPGRTYKFKQEDGTNATHRLRFYYDAAKTLPYTTGVTTAGTLGQVGAYTQIVVGDDTPDVLHYQCENHGYMGNAVTTQARNLTGHYLKDLENVDSATPTNNQVLTWDSANGWWEPQSPSAGGGAIRFVKASDSATSTNIIMDSAAAQLNIVAGSGLLLSATDSTNTITLQSVGGGGGSTNSAFSKIVVAGQSDVVADSSEDTLTLVAGTNVTLGTNAGSDQITINASNTASNATVTETQTTGSLADSADGNITFTGLGKSFLLKTLRTDRNAWIRMYNDSAAMSADSSRSQGVDPAEGSGVITEIVTSTIDTYAITPGIMGWIDSGSGSNLIVRVRNLSGSTGTVGLTLKALKLEA